METEKQTSHISTEEKNIFLQDLEENLEEEYEDEEEEYDDDDDENEETGKKQRKKKKSYSTAIFASIFVFFILIIILLIFLLGLADSGNPVFKAFGIEPYQIKSFLMGLANKSFMVILIILLLVGAIGIFRGYSTPKSQPQKRRAAFVFGGVSFGLIFFSILAWGGVIAFIKKFVVEEFQHSQIEMPNVPEGELVAPIDILFSASDILKELRYKKKIPVGLRWSKDGGKTYGPSSLNPEYTFQFLSDGVQEIALEVTLLSGKIVNYSRVFLIDRATFVTHPGRITQGKLFTVDASGLHKGRALFKWDFDDDGEYEMVGRKDVVKKIYKSKGQKTIRLRIEFDAGGVKNYTKDVIVYPEGSKTINAKIIVEKTKGKTPFHVTFDGSSSYSEFEKIVKYRWEIEGDRVRTEDIIDYTFKKPGKYTVKLTVQTESGKTDTEKILIEVEKGNSAPVAEIRTKPKKEEWENKIVGYIPFTVNFYGGKSTDADENIVQYKWVLVDDEDDQTIKELYGEKQEYVFRKAGDYTMKLRVSDSEGAFSEKVLKIKVKEPPVNPVVSMFPESGTAPLVVEFNASLSTCRVKDCKIISYEWDYNDDTKIVRGGAFTTHEFKKPGNYDVVLTAITDRGDRVSKTVHVTVTDTPLIACFSSSRTSGIAPVTVSFDPTRCSKGEIVKYQWDFGDGYVSGRQKTVHTYTHPGVYRVVLQVFNSEGRVDKMEDTITVNAEAEN